MDLDGGGSGSVRWTVCGALTALQAAAAVMNVCSCWLGLWDIIYEINNCVVSHCGALYVELGCNLQEGGLSVCDSKIK